MSSWYVTLLKTETNSEKLEDVNGKWIPFDRDAVKAVLKRGYPDINCEAENEFYLRRPTFDAEIRFDEEVPIEVIPVTISGDDEPAGIEVISYLCEELDCRALDDASGEFIELR